MTSLTIDPNETEHWIGVVYDDKIPLIYVRKDDPKHLLAVKYSALQKLESDLNSSGFVEQLPYDIQRSIDKLKAIFLIEATLLKRETKETGQEIWPETTYDCKECKSKGAVMYCYDEYDSLANGGSYEIWRCYACQTPVHIPLPD